jgi:hypothetical protein
MPVMRVSDAMRLGASLRPQTFNQLFDGHGTCALGAALDAIGCLFGTTPLIRKHACWNDVLLRPAACPCPGCDLTELYVRSVITHLNDQHRWTREQIADWVAEIEITIGPQHTHKGVDHEDLTCRAVSDDVCSGVR